MTGSAENQTNPVETDGLLFGCVLNGKGGARIVDWQEVESWKADDGPLWVHMDRNSPHVQSWLKQRSGLTQPTVTALLAEETRPRVFRGKKGIATILRGINHNTEASPEDMVAIRIWSDGNKLITLRHRRLMTPRDVLSQLVEFENGPRTISQLYERLVTRLTERMSATVISFDEKLDVLEADIDITKAARLRRELSDIRQDTVVLRRYMAPQREALNSLLIEPPVWLDDECRMHLRDTADRLLRYVEELDAARERSLIIKDDIANQLAESSNKTLYILAIISAIFLPLAFLTGLLGINIGGIPGIDNPYAFWIFCATMAVLLVIELLIFRHLKWL